MTSNELVAPLSGVISYWTGDTSQPPRWECDAKDHVGDDSPLESSTTRFTTIALPAKKIEVQ